MGPSLSFTAAAVVASLAALLWLGLGGWPGTPNGCADEMRPTCFCEAPRPGLIAQPANTLSNFGFVAAGLAIALVADRRRRTSASASNRMTTTRLYPALFAGVTALLGPGSMALHASQTRWGGLADVSSMYLYAGLLIAYALARLADLTASRFAALFAALVAVVVGAQAFGLLWSDFVFGALLAVFAGLEGVLAWRRRSGSIEARWLGGAAALFAVAFAIWVPSLSGGPLCDPHSPVQGHAIWHLLCAGSTLCLFAYFSSERAA